MEISNIAGDLLIKILVQGNHMHLRSKQVTSEGKFLIINGDDLCRDEKTDQAIVSAFKNGILTSTSAFINLTDSVNQLKKIHIENPGLPVGLHVNLTQGTPVAVNKGINRITDEYGQFYDIDEIIEHLTEMPVEEVRKELFAQAELFLSSGVPMDHINYHYHLAALYTPFFKIIREMALKYNVPVRNPVPASIYKLISLNGNGGGGSTGMKKLIRFGFYQPFKLLQMIKKVSLSALIEQEKLMFSEGIKSTDWFIDNFYGNASAANFISILEQLPDGVTEIMCHPSVSSELEVLKDITVKKKIEDLGIHLISWNHVVKPIQNGKIKNFNSPI